MELTTKLINRNAHQYQAHSGTPSTLAHLRRRHWISHNRVSATLKICLVCQKDQNIPFRSPKMPSLTQEHTSISRAFQHVGVDYCGLFSIPCNSIIVKVS
ncbi:hypothetical protein L596_000776 [Steinernema carpocapsae]|uniref:Integrase zinc-binding domain-containing protein n=1 Tax=Steinernema carpocapsae TaxID=34508 RepID=A0A4U8UJ78_STECR|nr:hypothetical protein L596_000776 [Steinernema carpocapsae]